LRRLGCADAKLCWVSLHSTATYLFHCYDEMRNPTTADFETETQKLLFLINLAVFLGRGRAET